MTSQKTAAEETTFQCDIVDNTTFFCKVDSFHRTSTRGRYNRGYENVSRLDSIQSIRRESSPTKANRPTGSRLAVGITGGVKLLTI